MKLSKNQIILMWALSVLMSALFLFAGSMKLMGGPEVAAQFEAFGYPAWFRYLIGFIEVMGAIGLLIPKIAAETASFLVIIMIGAVVTHVRAGDGFLGVLPALLVLLTMGGITWLRGEE